MTESIEQTAMRVKGETYPDWNVDIDRFLFEYATRLVAALGAQEPIGTVVDGLTFNWTDTNTKWSIPKGTPLYAAPIPSTCPTCTQNIDDAAKAGRIVDDRPPAPKQSIGKMLDHLMAIAVANGANSVSMPDEYVEVAAWLCDIPCEVPLPPDGWQLVPKEPTDTMLYMMIRAAASYEERLDSYQAMLAAAPEYKP